MNSSLTWNQNIKRFKNFAYKTEEKVSQFLKSQMTKLKKKTLFLKEIYSNN